MNIKPVGLLQSMYNCPLDKSLKIYFSVILIVEQLVKKINLKELFFSQENTVKGIYLPLSNRVRTKLAIHSNVRIFNTGYRLGLRKNFPQKKTIC